MPHVTITTTLTADQAQAFAQFLKRAGFSAYRANAVDNDEAYTMLYAGESLRHELAEAGFEPH